MAKNEKQKLKLILLEKYFLEESDEAHKLSMADLLSYLQKNGVPAERKSVYDDINCLIDLGMDIEKEKEGKAFLYYLASRDFEAAELKLLVDSVQSAKFISAKKSNELIAKLEKLAGRNQAKALQRQVYVSGRVKTDNKTLYYSVNEIHTAISENRRIRFHYCQWTLDGKLVKKSEDFYEVSPWILTVDDGNYYLVAFEEKSGIIKHYRVDKMIDVAIIEEMRNGRDVFDRVDVTAYEKQHFGMFHGEEQMVKLRCENHLAGVFYDRFGSDIKCVKDDDEHFSVTVKVMLNDIFLGWVVGLGKGIEIIGPDAAREKAVELAKRISEIYL